MPRAIPHGARSVPVVNRHDVVVDHAIVDETDFKHIAALKWHQISGYAVHYSGKGHEYMHRILLDAPRGLMVDHINGVPLDNRRSNLRCVTHGQNMQNRNGAHRGSRSRFRGVSWNKWRGRWQAQARLHGKRYHLGYFEDEREAGEAADIWRRKNMPFARRDPALES